MTVMTLNLVEKQPATMRRIIGKHLAVPRWQETCDYYNQMMERERLTVCFHAQLPVTAFSLFSTRKRERKAVKTPVRNGWRWLVIIRN